MSVRHLMGWAGQVLSWLVILVVVLVLAVAVLVPRVAGATPYSILTGSMRPSFPPGTLVVVKPVAADEVRVGDVITYQLESGEAPVVTHRVTAVSTSLGGETTFTTQGDANDVPDPTPVRPVQVRGRLWYSAALLGHLSNLMTGRQHQSVVLIAAGCLLAYAAHLFSGPVRDRGRRKEPSGG